MEALPVIEALDVLKDRLAGLGLILELPVPDQLILERSAETLGRRVGVQPWKASAIEGSVRWWRKQAGRVDDWARDRRRGWDKIAAVATP